MSSEAYLGGDDQRDPLANVPAECYDVLRHPRRIRVLAVLGRRETRLSVAELTSAIVEGEDRDVSTGRARHEARIGLIHNHLPRLADAGVVDWDVDTGAELITESPVHPADLEALGDLCERDGGRDLLEALVHPVRMRLVSVLSSADRPLSVDRLAAELVAREVGSLSDAESARIALYHVHLPMLADAGVLEFDTDAELVAPTEESASIVR